MRSKHSFCTWSSSLLTGNLRGRTVTHTPRRGSANSYVLQPTLAQRWPQGALRVLVFRFLHGRNHDPTLPTTRHKPQRAQARCVAVHNFVVHLLTTQFASLASHGAVLAVMGRRLLPHHGLSASVPTLNNGLHTLVREVRFHPVLEHHLYRQHTNVRCLLSWRTTRSVQFTWMQPRGHFNRFRLQRSSMCSLSSLRNSSFSPQFRGQRTIARGHVAC